MIALFPIILSPSPSIPASPTEGATLYTETVGGRQMPAVIDPDGLHYRLQPDLASWRVAFVQGVGNSATPQQFGTAAPTATGTATSAAVANTNLHTMMRGIEYIAASAGTTAIGGFKGPSSQWSRGNAAKIGGFLSIGKWGPVSGTSTASARAFAGMFVSSGAPTDIEPSTQTNVIGMGWDAADTNIQIMHNDASGTCTKVDLGASFPVPTTDRTAVYEIVLYCPPNVSYINWEVTDLVSDAKATGQVTTNMPANTSLMTYGAWLSAGGTSSTPGVALKTWYIGSNN